MNQKEFTERRIDGAQIQELIDGFRSSIEVNAVMLLPLAGGIPASPEALEAFAEHHLHLVPETDAFNDAIARINKEERDTTPTGGEVHETEVYGVNTLRCSENGPFIGAHQIKACMKQAASRLGMFQSKPGSKGDVAEMGIVRASEDSFRNPDAPWEIYLYLPGWVSEEGAQGSSPAETEYKVVSGSVSGPTGKRSIQTHVQVAKPGSRFTFCVEWPSHKLTEDDMVRILAEMSVIGLGSCLSLEFGKFKIEDMTIRRTQVNGPAKKEKK